MDKFDLSLIVACYNEEPHLRESIREIESVMSQTVYSYEIIFIDDCSRDNTREVIKDICHGKSNYRHVFHEKNIGRGGTVREGLLMARSPYAGFLDIDLEVHARYIPSTILFLENGYDMVVIERIEKFGFGFYEIIRFILSWGYKAISHFFLPITVPDSEVGYKFFNTESMREIVEDTKNKGWFWDTEIVYNAEQAGKKIKSFQGVFERKSDKESTVRIIPDTIAYLKAIFSFKKNKRSIIYRSPILYKLIMLILYRGQTNRRYEIISDYIDNGSSVIDLCCGFGELYSSTLKKKDVKYIGFDISKEFVEYAAKKGIDVRQKKIEHCKFPAADYYVMTDSLYHFHGNFEEVINKMLNAARISIIIMEPVKNLTNSRWKFLSKLSGRLTNEGDGNNHFRFSEQTLDDLIKKSFGRFVIESRLIPGGRDKIYVLSKTITL